MEYIKNEDYAYIINKYHDNNKPFDSFQRFIRNQYNVFPQVWQEKKSTKSHFFVQK